MNLLRLSFLPAALTFLPVPVTGQQSDAQAFFETRVRPILVERCLDCHSHTRKVKGGLALDSREDWMTGGDTGPAIVPGHAAESLLIKAVSWQDHDLQMPPKKKLSETEIGALTQWIQSGAHDPRGTAVQPKKQARGMSVEVGRKFWSYAPVRQVTIPEVKDDAWPQGAIDRFILAKLEQQGLKPGPDAPAEVLVRRLAYVLTGMPATPGQLDSLSRCAERQKGGVLANLREELMNSTQYGEKWARHWLDIVRFAESSGGGRTLLFKDAWRYRDYVIDAFNSDSPVDLMIKQQIAGDLLPAETREESARQLIATGFLALGPTIYEEQDKQKLRFDVIDEQLDTIGKAFLGQTIGCARCHDHKFDPITQRDYYALAGILASTRTLSNYTDNVVRWIDAPLPLKPEEEQRHANNERKLVELARVVKEKKNRLAKLQDEVSGIAGKQDQPLPLRELDGIVLDDQDAKPNGEWKHSTHSRHYFGQGYLHDDGKGKGAKTLAFSPKLPASGRYEVRLAYPALAGRATKVPVHIFHSMGDETVYVDQSREPDIAGRFISLGTYRFEKDGDSYVIVSNEGTKGYVCADVIQFLPERQDITAKNPNAGSHAISQLRTEVQALEATLGKLKQAAESRPLTMSVREEDIIGDTQICIRGDVHQRSVMVPRGFLSVAWDGQSPIPKQQSGRRELAEWLVSPDNPLTARVLVNRVWGWLFGAGLVRTVDNFGTTGEVPSHPELLDYLAYQFVTQGWSVKTLIREIVSSRTWQLAFGRQEQDIDNRWLSHANRRRLDAEQIRDSILSISGVLDRRVGGPNIQGATSIVADSGDASAVEFGYEFTDTRRSIYTPAFRNNRLELFEAFDFGDINTSQGQRYASTVAPQALYFMNHPFVLGQAELAATRALKISATDDQRLNDAFLRCVGRLPGEKERVLCLGHLRKAGRGERKMAWSMIYQSLFGCVDFRYLD